MNYRQTLTALTAVLLLAGGAAAQSQQPASTDRASTSIETILVNTDPVPVQSGEDAELTFKLRNTGNTEAEEVEVQLVDSFPFEVKPDRKVNYSLGNMAPGQEYQISTEVLVADDSPDGSNSFRVKVSHGDLTVTREVPVQVQSQDIRLNLANLQTQPSQLMPDTDSNRMTVDMVNNGEKTAENVVLNLELPEFFERTSSFSSRQALGNLQPGEVKTASFNFDIGEEAPKGEVSVDGEVSYTAGDSSSEVTEEVGFDLYMAGKPQYNVEVIGSDLATSSTGELRLEVTNTGSEESSSTRIRVLDSSDQPFTYGSSSQYIGTLEPNQSGEAVFEVETESGAAAKDYLLDFETRGVKGTEVFVEDETLRTSVNGSQSESAPPVIPIVLVLALLGAGVYFRGRIRELLK